MNAHAAQPLPHSHQTVIDRFVAACLADERVAAAFLGGSYARGAADEFSDLDLYLITTDEGYDDFAAGCTAFIQQLGEPLFLEDFDIPGIVFFVLADGTEGELGFGRVSDFQRIHSGPYRALVDKAGLLAKAEFHRTQPALDEQVETLRRQITWFWHELSHFITAIGRGRLWWAHGQIEAMRRICLNLARLQQDIFDEEAGEEGYFKVEDAVPAERLISLRPTYCPLEPEAMLQAVDVLVRTYQELAAPLAQLHRIPYPAALERVSLERLVRVDRRER